MPFSGGKMFFVLLRGKENKQTKKKREFFVLQIQLRRNGKEKTNNKKQKWKFAKK